MLQKRMEHYLRIALDCDVVIFGVVVATPNLKFKTDSKSCLHLLFYLLFLLLLYRHKNVELAKSLLLSL
jgi:hypothetical protein